MKKILIVILLIALPAYGANWTLRGGVTTTLAPTDLILTGPTAGGLGAITWADILTLLDIPVIGQDVSTTGDPSFNSIHASGGNLAAANKQVVKAWQTGLSYTADTTAVVHGGALYVCTADHTAGSTTEPGVGASWETVWGVVTGAGDDLGAATSTDVADLFTGTGDYLKSDGTKGTPTGGTVSASDLGYINIKNAPYNAKGDGEYYADGVVTAASNVLSSASAAFTSDDTGKVILVRGAGAGGIDLRATITYASPTTVTMSSPSSVTGSSKRFVFGTDDGAAIQDAIDDIAVTGGVIFFPRGVYINDLALQTDGDVSAQMMIPPKQCTDTVQTTIEFRGEFAHAVAMIVSASSVVRDGVQTGSIIQSTLTSGSGSILSGQHGTGICGFSSVRPVISNLLFRAPTNPTISGIDLTRFTVAELNNVVVDTGNYTTLTLAVPTNADSYALRLPANNNGAMTLVNGVGVIGFYNAIEWNEHANGDNLTIFGVVNGLVLPFAHHASYIKRAQFSDLKNNLKFTGSHYIDIEQLDLEHAAVGDTWETIYDVDDPNNYGKGSIVYHPVRQIVGWEDVFTKNGGANIYARAIGNRQSALDALTAVSGATNGHILTKDAATGSAKWQASGASVQLSDIVSLTLAAAPRHLWFVYGNSATGEEPPTLDLSLANAVTQASIDGLKAAGVPEANIRWIYDATDLTTLSFSSLLAGSSVGGITLTQAGGVLSFSSVESSGVVDSIALVSDSGGTFNFASLVSGSSVETATLVFSGGTFTFDNLLAGSSLEVIALIEGPMAEWGMELSGSDTTSDDGLYVLSKTGANAASIASIAGHSGNAIDFPGTAAYMSMAHNDDFSFTDGAGNDEPFSITAWIHTDTLSALRPIFSKTGTTGTGGVPSTFEGEYSFFLRSTGDLKFMLWDGDLTVTGIIQATTATSLLSAGVTYHVAATYDGSKTAAGLKIYLNGSLISTTNENLDTYTSMIVRPGTVNIGVMHPTAPSPFYMDGWIDEVKVFSRELSAAEVAADASL